MLFQILEIKNLFNDTQAALEDPAEATKMANGMILGTFNILWVIAGVVALGVGVAAFYFSILLLKILFWILFIGWLGLTMVRTFVKRMIRTAVYDLHAKMKTNPNSRPGDIEGTVS